MKSTIRCAKLGLALIALAFVSGSAPAPKQDIDPEAARKEINKFYDDWGKARVAVDTKAYDSMLSSDFKAILGPQTLNKEEFLKAISAPSPMTRFEATVLTVQKQGDLWVAVITEKIEAELKAKDGAVQKGYSLWVTRDSFRKTEDRWVAVSTEAIGFENWRGGKTPPIKHWSD